MKYYKRKVQELLLFAIVVSPLIVIGLVHAYLIN